MEFENPIGLAAGFDKSGELLDRVHCLGFGFTEIGTVTPQPQEGNPKPRLFRLRRERALLNRMGFNNDGMREVKKRLAEKSQRRIPIGINIGKNRETPIEEAKEDYRQVLRELFEYGDYFAINVSSPNTPNLRTLQRKEILGSLLGGLKEENERLAKEMGLPPKPLFVKVSPDLSKGELDDIVEVTLKYGITGLIATNSTSNHSYQEISERSPLGKGGLTGPPLRERATEVIRYLYRKAQGRIVIIGVGGSATGEDAYEKIQAGASLIQIYTGLIYEGPSIVKKINRELKRLLERDGYSNICEAIGSKT